MTEALVDKGVIMPPLFIEGALSNQDIEVSCHAEGSSSPICSASSPLLRDDVYDEVIANEENLKSLTAKAAIELYSNA